jgi:required for meiotic nuclear division protein 1
MLAKVYSYQIADSIDIKQFRANFTATVFHAEADELFYEIDNEKFLYVFKYGVVSFINYDETERTWQKNSTINLILKPTHPG